MQRLLKLLCLLLCLALGGHLACEVPQRADLTVLYTGDTWGAVEPCG